MNNGAIGSGPGSTADRAITRAAWAGKYVGIPYRVDGVDERGCDCWKLVRMVYAREAGIELPLLSDTSAQQLVETAAMLSAERTSEIWLAVAGGRQVFDIVTMRSGRHVTHCGVMVSPRHLLHIEERTSSVIVPTDHYSVRYRIVETVRHRALVAAPVERGAEAARA